MTDGSANGSLRVLIAGGGTGGHIIPALAVAHELVVRHSADILFVGTPRGMESRLVPDAGFRLSLIDVGPLKKDQDGVWRGSGKKGGQQVSVWVDYKGNVGQQ